MNGGLDCLKIWLDKTAKPFNLLADCLLYQGEK